MICSRNCAFSGPTSREKRNEDDPLLDIVSSASASSSEKENCAGSDIDDDALLDLGTNGPVASVNLVVDDNNNNTSVATTSTDCSSVAFSLLGQTTAGWKESSFFERIYLVLSSPLKLIFTITVPLVECDEEKKVLTGNYWHIEKKKALFLWTDGMFFPSTPHTATSRLPQHRTRRHPKEVESPCYHQKAQIRL